MTNLNLRNCPLRWLRSASWLLASTTLLLAACEKPALEPSAATVSTNQSQLAIGLESKANPDNPFSYAIMRQAYDSLMAKKLAQATTGAASGNPPATEFHSPIFNSVSAVMSPTHQYLRFLLANTSQLADLGDAGFELSWEPLDETVAASTTVDFTSQSIPWVYTVVPTGTSLPAGIQTEVLQDLYLFNEDDADIQDLGSRTQTPAPLSGTVPANATVLVRSWRPPTRPARPPT